LAIPVKEWWKDMRGVPSKFEVVVGDPLPLYRLEILKELIRKVV
jgi:hypothetical protein